LKFDPQDATRIVLALAAGELSEEKLTDWFRDHLA
jgi:prophage maintenance system killer protein